MGRGKGRRGAERPSRSRTQTHSGESDCSTLSGKVRQTFPRHLRDFKTLHINSFPTLIVRAAVNIKYLVCIKHVLILQYFIARYWQSYQLDSDSAIWKYTVCSIEYLLWHLILQTLLKIGGVQYTFDLKKELHSQLEQKWVISKTCSGKHEIELISL